MRYKVCPNCQMIMEREMFNVCQFCGELGSEVMVQGRYLVQEKISEGGMGEVFRAWDLLANETVAIKVTRRSAEHNDARWESIVKAFRKEAYYTQCVEHNNVVAYRDSFEHPNCLCLVLEYLDGVSLYQWSLEHPRINPKQLLWIMQEVTKGLHAIHQADLVHCDLKPENIIITTDNRVVLIDLGIAFDLLLSPKPQKNSMISGTPGYLSPEQLANQTPTPASDMYALGLIMFELVAGRPLFYGKTAREIIQLQWKHKSPNVELFLPRAGFWKHVAEAIRGCLKEYTIERMDSVDELCMALNLECPSQEELRFAA